MEPISATAAIVSIVSSFASFFGANNAANQARREGRRMAADALERGEFDYERYAEQAAGFLGTQRARTAGQNVDVTQGTAAIARAQSEAAIADDLQMIRDNALKEAYALRRGYNNQASAIRSQSYGALGNAFGTLGQFGANAWDVYQRGRTPPAAPNTRPVVYNQSYGPPQF